jgi:hypothetical protein
LQKLGGRKPRFNFCFSIWLPAFANTCSLGASLQTSPIKQKINIFKQQIILKMKREKVLDTVKDLPKNFELEMLIEKLIFVEKVEQGLVQLKKGKTISHDSVKELVKKW